jgi:hypothetical protein
MNRVESVSGARMQAIFVLLNHQDMCHEKYGEAPCNWHPDNRSQNWVTEIQDTLTAYGVKIFTAENLQERNLLEDLNVEGKTLKWT